MWVRTEIDVGARVIHFGWNDCHRPAVLRRAGYEVTEAGSLSELSAELRIVQYDAVVLSADEGMELAKIGIAVRRETRAPLVLFRGTHGEMGSGEEFDLIVDCLVS